MGTMWPTENSSHMQESTRNVSRLHDSNNGSLLSNMWTHIPQNLTLTADSGVLLHYCFFQE